MKKMFLIVVAAVLGGSAAAQLSQAQPLFPDNVKYLPPANGYLNAINTRAIRDFVKKNKEAGDVIWYQVHDGYIVRFTLNDIPMRSAYDKHGHWVYTIKSYPEKGMPRDVRALVKSNYYDYSIKLVEEIEQPRQPTHYVVHIEDDKSWKNLVVYDGIMETLEEYKKL